MKTFKQFLDLLSEAPLPPKVERSIEVNVGRGIPYRKARSYEDDDIINSVRRDTGYRLPKHPPGGYSRAVVGDRNPLKITIHNGPNDSSPMEYNHPTVTKISKCDSGVYCSGDDDYRYLEPNRREFSLRDTNSVLLPHPNGKEHHYINNFEHGVLAPAFKMSNYGEYIVAGKVKPLDGNLEKASAQMKKWTKTKDHPGVTISEYNKAFYDENSPLHPNKIVRQHQEFARKNNVGDINDKNVGGYTDPVSKKTKLVILDAGEQNKSESGYFYHTNY